MHLTLQGRFPQLHQQECVDENARALWVQTPSVHGLSNVKSQDIIPKTMVQCYPS
jgi:hypothetical protein